MPRFITSFALGFICFAISPLAFGQTKDGQTRDRRLDDAQADIRLLKRVIDEQARRITALEKSVKALEAAAAEKPAENRARIAPKPFTGPRWQNPFAWSQVNMGMSRAEVEAILGPPTTVDSVIDYQTLHYSGQVAGETLSGTVKLTDDRVSDVSLPDF
jgi:hypothetical protein